MSQQLTGKALDAEVERTVFGRCPHANTTTHDLGPGVRGVGVTCADCGAKPGTPEWGGSVPPYATNIEAAWRVVEALASRGYFYTVHAVIGRQHGASFCLYVEGSNQHPISYAPTSASAPEAICRAALAALRRTDVAA